MSEPKQAASMAPGAEAPLVAPPRVAVDVAARTDRGRVRELNEDSYVICRLGRYLERIQSSIPDSDLPLRHEDTGHLMVVADGMGGHAGGEVASRNAIISIIQFLMRSPKWALKLDDPATREREIAELFTRGREHFSRVHSAVRQQAAADPNLAQMGTTLTGAYAVGVDLFVLHIGDSKACLLRNGVLMPITRDHTVAQEYADLGLIEQGEVANHQMAHVLTRAIGGPAETISTDIQHRRLQDGDRVVLCSDGLTDMVDPEVIANVLRANPTSADACSALVDAALDHGGRDNVTVIVAGFTVT